MAAMHFKWYLCNQVDDIAGNEVSLTKQARGEKNLARNQAQSGGQMNQQSDCAEDSSGSCGLVPMAV